MNSLASSLFDVSAFDHLSRKDTWIHQRDPRAKLLVTFVYILNIVSMTKYNWFGLIGFTFYPILVITAAQLPWKILFQKLILVSPFALFIGILNPWLERSVYATPGGIPISFGFVSFVVIMLKFILTTLSALILISTTPFYKVCIAMNRLKCPWIIVNQIQLLFRYLQILLNEALTMSQARDMRSFQGRGKDWRTTSKLLGALFLRTIKRSERIFSAMVSRGFTGHLPSLSYLRYNLADGVYIFSLCFAFLGLRLIYR